MRELWLMTAIVSAPVAIMLFFGVESYAVRHDAPVLPPLSTQAIAGRADFVVLCANCHGLYGEGSERGPNLVMPEEGDRAFSTVAMADNPVTQDGTGPSGGLQAHVFRSEDGALLNQERLETLLIYLREMQAANRRGA